jgi:hypothetical protein
MWGDTSEIPQSQRDGPTYSFPRTQECLVPGSTVTVQCAQRERNSSDVGEHNRGHTSPRDVVPTKVSPDAERWNSCHLHTPGSISIHKDEHLNVKGRCFMSPLNISTSWYECEDRVTCQCQHIQRLPSLLPTTRWPTNDAIRVSIPLHQCETGGDVHILMGRDTLVLTSTHQNVSVRDTIEDQHYARPARYPRTLRWLTDGAM